LVLEASRTNNNLSHEERKSLRKLAKLTEERKIVICQADKDGKIAMLNYEDYDTIMAKELQQFEKLDVSVEGCDTYTEKLRKDCNDLMVKLHNLGAVNDELLLHVTGIKCKSNSYRKVNGALPKFFCCNTPAYPLFKTHKLSPENLLNVDIKGILVRLLQSVGNISTSRITAFVELILKPISTNFFKN